MTDVRTDDRRSEKLYFQLMWAKKLINFSASYEAVFTYHNRIPWVPRRQPRTPSPVRDAAPEESLGLRTGALQGWAGWCRSSMRPTRRRESDLAEKKIKQFISSKSTQIYHEQSSVIIFLPCTNSNGRTHQGFLSQEMYKKRATFPTKPAYRTLAWPTNQPEQVSSNTKSPIKPTIMDLVITVKYKLFRKYMMNATFPTFGWKILIHVRQTKKPIQITLSQSLSKK